MIKIVEDYFILETKNTMYIFKKDKSGYLIHLYYGKSINIDKESLDNLLVIPAHPIGTDLRLSKENMFVLEVVPQELSSFGKGDLRHPCIMLKNTDSNTTNMFTYDSYELIKSYEYSTLPSVKDDLGEGEALRVNLSDKENNIDVSVIYTVFSDYDVISRKTLITNKNKESVLIKNAYSLELDFRGKDYSVKTFHGSWANEMNAYDQKIGVGRFVNESLTGTSSNRTNPLVYLYKDGAGETSGDAYAFNLLYSGNHQTSIERDFNDNIRLLSGINPFTFEWNLKENETFEVPEGIMSYSSNGFSPLSINLQNFVRNHIIEKEFRYFPRKVLNNSWEACYFNFNERKLLSMAKCAKKLGVELFVLDDGWFGERNDDTKGLGDWIENRKKMPSGLKGFSKKINDLGLEFGIWVEPEMVNENSDLYRKHPEWALRSLKHHTVGRNQMILDLTNKEVEDYLFDSMCYVFSESNASYIKWDMNRCFSDYYSQTLDKSLMGEVSHRYYLGLYSLIKRLKEKFPHILIEGCASGGNRFDLGILSYMPQIWASDNTDPFVRQKMQYNYSYGYPMSTLGMHVASSPCLNTLRRSTLEDRFSTSLFGAFGYEIDLREESKKSKKIIMDEIRFYKENRDKIITSDFYRIKNDERGCTVLSVSKDKELALLTDKTYVFDPIRSFSDIKLRGLNPDYTYNITSETHEFDIRKIGSAVNQVSKIHIRDGSMLQSFLSHFIKLKEGDFNKNISGSLLNNNFIPLNENFNGAGINFKERFALDFTTKFYIIKKI